MTSSSTPNVVIVVVVITRDSGQDPAPATVAEDTQACTRHEHAQADSSQSPAGHPG
jgi:hypothetical protein